MKKIFAGIAVLLLLFALTACNARPALEGVDIDMSTLNEQEPTMIYVLCTNVAQKPQDYIGKTVCVQGHFNSTGDGYARLTCYDNTGCCTAPMNVHVANLKEPLPEGYIVRIYGTFAAYDQDPECPIVVEAERGELAEEYYPMGVLNES